MVDKTNTSQSKKASAFLLSIAICILPLLTSAQQHAPKDSIDLFIALKMQQLHIPGLQLAIVSHGKVQKLKAYGLANIEHNIPVTDQSIFAINSCTKSFVGVAVMQLQEEGKLKVSDPISKYLSDLPESWKKITISQVLTHSSGLPNIMDQQENIYGGGNEAAALAKVKTLPMEFSPGERFSYNQTGYVIIGKIISQLSGMHFTTFIEQRQFKPAGMELTRFGDSGDIIPNSAGGYTTSVNVDGKWSSTDTLKNLFTEFPLFFRTATGMLSTSGEIAKWIIALQEGKLLKQQASIEQLWSPAILSDGKVGGFSKLVNGYALGWPTVTRDEHPAVAPIGGLRSAYFVYPKDDLSIIVLTNLQGANPEWFIDELAGYYIPEMQASNGFGLSRPIKKLQAQLEKGNYQHALQALSKLRKADPGFVLSEDELNIFGYWLLGQQQPQRALAVFELYTKLYPTSGNAYDSYAEVLGLIGDKNGSIKNYKRSLELDPKNTNATEQLKKLEGH